MDADFPPERKTNNQNQVSDRFAVKDTGTRRPTNKPRGEQGARKILLWFGLGFIFIFIIALFVVALSGGNNNLLSAFGVQTDIKAVLSRVSNVVFGIIFVCAIIALVIGGFMHLAALGEPNQIRRARKLLLRSGITLMVTAVFWIIFTLLLGNVSLPSKQVDTGVRIVTTPTNLTAAAPFAVKFDVNGLNSSGNFFSWDFGDGNTGTGPSLSHEYQKEGFLMFQGMLSSMKEQVVRKLFFYHAPNADELLSHIQAEEMRRLEMEKKMKLVHQSSLAAGQAEAENIKDPEQERARLLAAKKERRKYKSK